MQQFLKSRSTKGLAGNLFEIAVIDSVTHGGSFPCRRLVDVATVTAANALKTTNLSVTATPAKAEVLSLRKSELSVSFDSLAMIGGGCRGGVWALSTHRFVPSSPNFASIDSIEVGLRLLQLTTMRTNHGLKVTSGRSDKEGLAAIAETLLPHMGPTRWGDTEAYLEVFFFVPEGNGAAFRLQELEFYSGASDPAVVPQAEPAAVNADSAPPRDVIDEAGET